MFFTALGLFSLRFTCMFKLQTKQRTESLTAKLQNQNSYLSYFYQPGPGALLLVLAKSID